MSNKGLHHEQQQFIYSPPHQSAKELHESHMPIQVPTLTPPHSSTTAHHQIRYDSQISTKDLGNDPPADSVKSTATKLSSSTALGVAAKDDQLPIQHLPPRKRIQSLKKQFTKPNLSAPVSSQSLIHDVAGTSTTTTTINRSFPTQAVEVAAPAYPNCSRSRSPSPILDIEDDSGDTTETDDDDIQQQRRKSGAGESTSLKSGASSSTTTTTTTNYIPGGPKPAIIIQHSAVPATSGSKASLNITEPLKKHWRSSSLQSSQDLRVDQQRSIGFNSLPLQDTDDEKPRKPKKKKGLSQPKDGATLSPFKIKKTSDRSPKSRMKKPGALYCICQTPYDAPRFMIACDRCDQWFHGECIGISEKEGEFIDLYFCDDCGKETGKTTSWKSRCGNPACSKAARINSHQGYLSKYCSHNCGMQVARARLELTEMKRRQQTNTPTDNTTNIPQLAINKQRQSRLSSNAEKEDQHRLEQLRKQKLRVLDIIRMIEQKQLFLGMTEQQLQDSDMCGFDPRLVWDDQLWIKVQGMVVTGDEPIIILQYDDDSDDGDISTVQQSIDQQHGRCQLLRKDCRQHQQWPRLLDLEMKQERNEQLHIIKMLEKEKREIKNRMRQRRNEVDLANSLENGTITYY